MGIPLWVVRMIGKAAGNKIGLEEGGMKEGKQWWLSKGVWTGVLTILVGAYETARVALAPHVGWTLPDIPPFVYTLLGAMGLYSRVVAKDVIRG